MIAWRLAEPGDNERLCELFASVSMKTDLHLTVERDPDFFQLYSMQDADACTFVATKDGVIEGVATYMARDGWLGGERVRLGYAGDLRFTRKLWGGRALGKLYPESLAAARQRLGVDLFGTAIITSNKVAVSALTKRRERYPDMPIYTPLADFRIANVQFTNRKRPRRSAQGLTVRKAADADLPAIAEHLSADHRRRPFGYVFTEALLRHRVERWPGLDIGSFYLAEAPDGALRGVTAAWDAEEVKRYRVLGYYDRMVWVRRGFNLWATLGRFPKLPPPGELLRYFYLTHVSVPDDDPEVMAALVDRIYADHHGRGYHFLCACILDDDPLAPAYDRYLTNALPARLYAVTAPDTEVPLAQLTAGRPGFEMALV